MRSATSYFNGTLYRKSLARFWPLWVLYGVIWLFALPLNMLTTYFSRYMSAPPQRRLLDLALNVPDSLSIGLLLAAFFAILCAMAVFGYLYNHRSACWTHALPLRREALFATQYLAGLSFLLLPQLTVALLSAIIEVSLLPMSSWSAVLSALLTWLLAQSGVCLFFFSFAAFCAMFTGHILALPAFYCILNVLASVIYTLMDGLFHQFFFGYTSSSGAARLSIWLTPFLALRDALLWRVNLDESRHLYSSVTVAVYAAVGAGLALASLYVYRRRHVETAGDVVAVPLVRPLFKYGVSFCSGLCIGMFTAAFFSWSRMSALVPCILFWTVIGCFAAEMLQKKSFRVFKAWKGPVIMACVMLLLCLGCYADLLGVSAKVPKLDQVDQVDVELNLGYPNDQGSYLSLTLTDPENIQRFLELHQALVDDRARLDYGSPHHEAGQDYTSLQLRYTLKGGSSLNRKYSSLPLYRADLENEGSFTALVQSIAEDREMVAQAYGFDSFLTNSRLTGAWLTGLTTPEGHIDYDRFYVDDFAKELWEAVQQDFAQGNLGERYLFDSDPERQQNTYYTDLEFVSEEIVTSNESAPAAARGRRLSITLTPQAKHTLAVLDRTGLWEQGYALAARDLADEEEWHYPETAGGGMEIVY